MAQSLLEGCDRLLEEVRDAIAAVNKAGGAAQTAGRLSEAEQALARAKGLEAIRMELEAIRERLTALVGENAPETATRAVKEGRAPTGRKTPNDAFRVPILRALVALGGSAPMQSVLQHVHDQIGDRFVTVDLQPLPSDPDSVRWKNTAQWCRLRLKHEGLLRDDSPWGVWEISEAGRRWLEEHG